MLSLEREREREREREGGGGALKDGEKSERKKLVS